MKNILSILLCVFTWISLSAQTAKYLKPLNEVLFGEKLNQAITRKTFAQLQQTSQLAHLSQAEKTLLLTHKFIEEHQRWPRTQITRGNATPETYSPQEQEEVVLAIWAELFAQYAHPTQAGRWHTKSAFSSQEILSAPSTYANQELEMLRLLYRQFSTK